MAKPVKRRTWMSADLNATAAQLQAMGVKRETVKRAFLSEYLQAIPTREEPATGQPPLLPYRPSAGLCGIEINLRT